MKDMTPQEKLAARLRQSADVMDRRMGTTDVASLMREAATLLSEHRESPPVGGGGEAFGWWCAKDKRFYRADEPGITPCEHCTPLYTIPKNGGGGEAVAIAAGKLRLVGRRMDSLCWNIASAFNAGTAGELAFPKEYRDAAVECYTAWREAEKAYEAAQRDTTPTNGGEADYARRLAVGLWQRHYREVAPQWEPCADLMGLLSQIDNMASGLRRLDDTPPATSAPVVDNWSVIVEGLRLADQFFDGDDHHWEWDNGETFPASKVRAAYRAALSGVSAPVGVEEIVLDGKRYSLDTVRTALLGLAVDYAALTPPAAAPRAKDETLAGRLAKAKAYDNPQMPENERKLRRLLALRVAGMALYADDGELTDGTAHPVIDFLRFTPEQIEAALRRRAEKQPDATPAASEDGLLGELDALIATEAKLNFARDGYDDDAATAYGISLLDFMRKRGMELRRRLAASGQGVEGWKWVPANATNNMQIAGLAALDESDATPDSIGHLIGYKAIREAYAAMVAAAPTQEKGDE